MKILNLKFKNINSLAGEWQIDFTKPQFTDSGLFAITGKTGSGKSSILDAITLALFGKTPRVEITGQNNEVMTHGTNDCYSEIVFEAGGKKWKSSWKQEKTRTGNLKPVSRQIADEADQILADQLRNCDTKIVEILGLTFEQFTKVILLAQGSFAAFLQADKNEKGELLEQITGTEIYGEISKKTFERSKAEREKLDRISLELQSIKTLTEKEVEQLNSDIATFEEAKKQTDSELQVIETEKNRLVGLENLQKQIAELKQKLPELEGRVAAANEAFIQSETTLSAAKKQKEETEKFLVKVRELDTIIAEKNKTLNPVLPTTSKREKPVIVTDLQTVVAEKKRLLQEKTLDLQAKQAEFSALLSGKELSDYQKEKECITQLGISIKELITIENAILENRKEIGKQVTSIATFEVSEKELSATVSEHKIVAQNLEKQVELLDENIKLAQTIRSLEEHRHALEAGKPCPLCGATEHPFAQGNIPQIGEKELALKKEKAQHQKIIENIRQDEQKLVKLVSDKNNAEENQKKEEKQLSNNEIKRDAVIVEIQKLNPDFSIPDGENKIEGLSVIHKQKQQEFVQISEFIAKATESEKLLKNLRDKEIPQLQQDELQIIVNHRFELFGDQKVEVEENRLKKLLLDAENSKKDAELAKSNIDAEYLKNKAVVLEKEKELTAKRAEKTTEKSFEELQIAYNEKKEISDGYSQKTGANRQELTANSQKVEAHNNKQKEQEQQQQIFLKWSVLNDLIGSQDGKKYRNFAQALTFEHLIELANRQLQKMSERYILKRDGDAANPFELLVIDKFQNCDQRTAQNLSGGEKFIVSLALALGLANMASRNMNIDTMFIDEGFGTLDADYLDVAIAALSNLQNEGKLIGVISHLSELKERIVTHIAVTPTGNGHSKIEIRD